MTPTPDAESDPHGEPDPDGESASPPARPAGGLPTVTGPWPPWRGLTQALLRHTRIEANDSELAPWELLIDNRIEAHHAVAALRDWSRVQLRLGELDAATDPAALYAALHELAAVPEVAGAGIAVWLRRLYSLPTLPPAATPVNLHLARCIHAEWLGRRLLERVRRKQPAGPVALYETLTILEQAHDPRFARRSLVRPLQEMAARIRGRMQAEAGEDWLTLRFGPWLESFGRHAQAVGLEGKVNALNRYDACLGSGFFHNGLAIPITLCALVQYVIHRVAGGDRPIRARGLNTPGHFLLLVEEAGEQVVVDPFRGLYNLSWKSLMHQLGARELAALTPEALLLEQPSDILPRMCLNALKRLENLQQHLLSAEYCTLHYAVSQDANLVLQRALLRIRGRAPGLAREDLALVMQSENETAAKLAQKFMMREDFYLSQHPN